MDNLIRLKQLLHEDENSPILTDTQLITLINKHGGITSDTLYEGFLLKAQCDAGTLPDGTKTESNREYWLTLAKNCRPSQTGTYPVTTDCKYL